MSAAKSVFAWVSARKGKGRVGNKELMRDAHRCI
jgi:hypothetical protein